MSQDYAEYGRENIQIDPLRVREVYEVGQIERIAGTKTIEIYLVSRLGEITLRLPIEVSKAFYVGQKCHMMLTEVTDLGVEDA